MRATAIRLVLALAFADLMGGCATDHSAAVSLGTAGVTATQALSDQTATVSQTVRDLQPWWGVRDALVCAAVSQPDARSECIKTARAAPDLRGRVDGLEELALVLRDARVGEAADLWMRGEQACEQSRAAAVQACKENEAVILHGATS